MTGHSSLVRMSSKGNATDEPSRHGDRLCQRRPFYRPLRDAGVRSGGDQHGPGARHGVCCRAERSNIQLLSRPYRPRLRSPKPSSTALHCLGSAAANWSTNRGSVNGSKCRSDITRTCPATACAGTACWLFAAPHGSRARAASTPYRRPLNSRVKRVRAGPRRKHHPSGRAA